MLGMDKNSIFRDKNWIFVYILHILEWGHKKTKQNKKYTVHQIIKDYLKKS